MQPRDQQQPDTADIIRHIRTAIRTSDRSRVLYYQHNHPALFMHHPDLLIDLAEKSMDWINRKFMLSLINNNTAFNAIPETCQIRFLKHYVHVYTDSSVDAKIVCAILKQKPALFNHLDNLELDFLFDIAINERNLALIDKIQKKNIKDPFDILQDMTRHYHSSFKQHARIAAKQLGNIFKKADVDSFTLLTFFVKFEFFAELNAMLAEVDRTKVMAEIEKKLHSHLTANVYHLPNLSDPLYQQLKKHGFLSKEFIAATEDFTRSLRQMPRVVWDTKDTAENTTVKMMSTLATNPLLSKSLGRKIASLKSIDFYDGGESADSWSDMLKQVVGLAPAPAASHGESCIDLEMKAKEKSVRETSLSHITRGYKFLRLQGRTILLENKHHDILAIKVLKKNEDVAELHREAKAVAEFQKKSAEMDLQSYFPEPVKVAQIDGLITWLKQQEKMTTALYLKFMEMVSVDPNPEKDTLQFTAYIYKVDRNHRHYFTYLHDTHLTDAEFAAANRTAVADLYKLFANGVVFHQLADIFHNKEHVEDRDDKGRYIVLANLVSSFAMMYDGGGGSGRITGWQQAIAYPNIRGTGLADFGDVAELKEFFSQGEKAKRFFGAAQKKYKEKTGNYLMANIMAEYQYILYLIAGYRACKQTLEMKDEAAVKKIWRAAAMQIVDNCAHAIALLTPQTEESAKLFLLSRVNVKRLGKQMQFWMRETKDGFEYLEHVKQNKIPASVYGRNVKVHVSTSGFREGTFNPTNSKGKQMGFAIDGEHPDLGPVNGQEPVKEKDKLLHWMVTIIFNAYHQYRLTRNDIAKLQQKKKSKPEATNAFEHLTRRDYHATMFALTKKELAEKKVTRQAKTELIAKALEARKHQREYAATAIQDTWRAHKFRRVISGDKEEKVAATNEVKPLFRSKKR